IPAAWLDLTRVPSTAGAAYTWCDETANLPPTAGTGAIHSCTGGTTALHCRYWLEEITLDGRHRFHGPAEYSDAP
ncbi:MAG: hypothetical protein N3D11_09605, partial [Candidatus Sumerlaeia bacterium]|nr:hypothetical protein [Candidatus Sumerlaeia bacterium]